jgi:hypothetical protein
VELRLGKPTLVPLYNTACWGYSGSGRVRNTSRLCGGKLVTALSNGCCASIIFLVCRVRTDDQP